MTKTAKTILFAGAATIAMSAATGAWAQDTAAPGAGATSTSETQTASADEGAESGEIIVTARKRAEDIQTVPIAITAYTAQDLAERNISNLADLGNATAGVAITSITGGTNVGIFIRGLSPGNNNNDLNVDANVGLFIDGIYQTSRNTIDIISVLDVGQIEIAKGPQSALYGKSTFAGAFGISTKRTTRDLSGSISATAGQDEDYRVKATISGPLSDTMSARLAAGYVTYDGYGTNSANTKDNLGGFEKYAVNASFEWEPTENFKARVSGFITHSKSELSPTTLLPISSFNCGNTTTSALGGASAAAPRGQLFCGTLPAFKVSSLEPNAPDTVAKNRQISVDLNWDFGPASLVSLTGFNRSRNSTYNDYDGTAGGITLGVCNNSIGAGCIAAPQGYTRLTQVNALSISRERVHTFSQELRVQSDDESAFKWMLGGYYFDSQIPLAAGGVGVSAATPLAANERLVAVPLNSPPAVGTGVAGSAAYEFTANPFLIASSLTGQLSSSYSDSGTKTKSLFGSVGYDFGDFEINAEGRYNVDTKHAQNFAVLANPTSAPGVNQAINGTSVPSPTQFPNAGTYYKKKFKSFAPRVTLDWQATDDVFLYASVARGIRSGGFNTINPAVVNGVCTAAANACILQEEVAYAEEKNWTYEGGFKTNLVDRRLLLNASVFHVDWKNAQVSGFTQNALAGTVNRIVLNIGAIKTTGVELQTDFKLTDMFTVGGNFVYSDPKFGKGLYDGGTVAQCVVGATTGTTAVAGAGAPGCPNQVLITRANGTIAAVPDISGRRPQRSVKTQWNVHAIVATPLNDEWKLSGRVDVNYTGSAYNNLLNSIAYGKRTLTNVRIGAESDHFSVALFANNLFDKKYVQNSINQPRIGIPFAFSVPEIYLGETRRVGVTGTYKF